MKKLTTYELIAQKGSLEDLKQKPRHEVYLVLDNIRSMYNVGAIFRSADAAGVKKLMLCGITAFPPRKEIDKTALGTTEYVPWQHYTTTQEAIEELKQNNVRIAALEQTDSSVNYLDYDYKKPIALVLGHEVTGIDDEILKMCDDFIEIPMAGIANSLNVATAAGIILFEAIKK